MRFGLLKTLLIARLGARDTNEHGVARSAVHMLNGCALTNMAASLISVEVAPANGLPGLTMNGSNLPYIFQAFFVGKMLQNFDFSLE